jgi:hypothetical protein
MPVSSIENMMFFIFFILYRFIRIVQKYTLSIYEFMLRQKTGKFVFIIFPSK